MTESLNDFVEKLPAWVWVYQGHAREELRFFYRVPRELLYKLINHHQGVTGAADAWYYHKARETGCTPVEVRYFNEDELVTHVAIEAEAHG